MWQKMEFTGIVRILMYVCTYFGTTSEFVYTKQKSCPYLGRYTYAKLMRPELNRLILVTKIVTYLPTKIDRKIDTIQCLIMKDTAYDLI